GGTRFQRLREQAPYYALTKSLQTQTNNKHSTHSSNSQLALTNRGLQCGAIASGALSSQTDTPVAHDEDANESPKETLEVQAADHILWDLGVPQIDATLLYEDNDACTAMANARKPTSRTRHMDIKYHVLCEWVDRDLLKLVRIDTSLNMADHHTKSLGPALFHRHNDYILGHVPPTYSPMCCI
ncbi:hypothetical protein THAOC_36634, partial [Thalassiosira oceanica]